MPSSTPPPEVDDEEDSWEAPAESKQAPAATAVSPPTPSLQSDRPAPHSEAAKTQPSTERAAKQPIDKFQTADETPERVSAGQHANADENASRSARGSRVALLVAAAVLFGGAWLFLRAPDKDAPVAQRSTAVESASPATAPPEPAKVEPAVAPTPSAPIAAEAPAPSASNAAMAVGEPTPRSDELIVVTVSTIPEDARFFYKGKPVGRSPFRVELKRGQRRSFEIGRPGFHARKVVVDGTKSEMTVTMKPEIHSPPAPAASPTAPE